jgi:hypothetical protein
MRRSKAEPDRLRGAADVLDQAAAGDDQAAGRFAEARGAQPAFGISAQARDLAGRWEAAIAAREQDARVLGDETSDLAGHLRIAADVQPRDDEPAGRVAAL